MPLEQPWHERHASPQQHRWFQNLADLHRISVGWLKAVNVDRPAHFLERGLASGGGLGEEVSQSLWMLEKLTGADDTDSNAPGLESFLDDTFPEDTLGRLDRSVRAVQVWVLSTLVDKAAEADRTSVLNQLEQACWRAGRDCASRRWPTPPESSRSTVSGLVSLALDQPFAGAAGNPPYLVVRAAPEEAVLELLACPHESRWSEVSGRPLLADQLCSLQRHWMKGYVYSLNTRAQVETWGSRTSGPASRRLTPRCRERWSLAP